MKILSFLSFFLLAACTPGIEVPAETEDSDISIIDSTISIKYLALGDSYTIGEGVSQDASFPFQLVENLKDEGISVIETQVIARTGWTTDELKSDIVKRDLDSDWDLVSLLIGVNNQYRGRSATEFRDQFEDLLAMAIEFAQNDSDRVFVLSIPDYGITPFGQNRNANGKVSKEIDEFNQIKREVCSAYQVEFFDITEISRLAEEDLSLLAPDQLHPSGKMYQLWVEEIINQVIVNVKAK